MNYRRKLNFTECYSKVCHDYAQCTTNLMGMIQLTGPLKDEQLKLSLEWMQKRHPMLRSYLGESDNKYDYLKIDTKARHLPLQIIEREDEGQWEQVAEKSIGTPFTEEGRYLWRFHMLTGGDGKDATHDLIITFMHSISDGISIGSFFEELLDLLSSETQPPAAKILEPLPPIEETLRKTTTWPGFLIRNIGATLKYVTKKELNTLEKYVPLSQRKSRLIYREIDAGYLNALIERCREENTTLTGLLTGILALSVYKVTCSGKGNSRLKQITFTPVSLRGHSRPEIESEQIGCYVNFYRTTHILDANENLWDIARSYKDQLTKAIKNPGNMPPKSFSKGILIKSVASLDQGFMKNIFPYGIGVTNIGRVGFPLQNGPFKVKKFHFGTNRNLGDWLTLMHTSSVEDRLYLCFCFAEPLLSETSAEQIATNVVTSLLAIASNEN